ncbi:TPA: hypothetical protein ACV5EY_000747 [Klebsiella aerogenes]|nr:hypothetical protein [Klebsiella aerogenes]
MKTPDIDMINRVFYPGWLMVSQLRNGQQIKDGELRWREKRLFAAFIC